ncbi:hypothetical protein ACFQZ1_08125 [Bacillus sp. CGMCC 1.60114]|uniref:hypothetical protein n=1 Tax=unclassified Bacillus (in: firmicutes) TaxID=185979 RepID=UPI00362589BF
MYESHSIFEIPTNEDAKVWRYMDFTKFVSVLANKSLFFTRADKFRDKFEGAYSIFNRLHAHQVYGNHLDQDQIQNFIRDKELMSKNLRERTIISCWHMNEYESAAMWDLYLKTNEGIAIQTTFKRLCESFQETEENIYIGKVRYIDFDREWMSEGNAFYPFVHKRISFKHENEIRAIHSVFPELDMPSPFKEGKNIKIDINKLIEKVYVCPDAPSWFCELVNDVMKRYEVNKQAIHSNLYELPK